MQPKNRGWMVLALFFGSGATALIYEVVWAKFLAQMFGSTIYAQTAVLAVFMGGLALGNRIFGRWADGLRQPVKAYGVLEILIGIYAFWFPALDRATDRIFVALGTPIAEHAGWLLLLQGVLCAALLLGPTILMGGTLPLLAAWLRHDFADAGRRSARFYSVNSLGAVTGAALAGFWLVQRYGMIATIEITAAANVLIGASAIVLNRSGWLARRDPATKTTNITEPETPASPATLRWAGVMVALTGGVSMGLEVLASRSLALIFGSSLQSFAVVLIAFILGIGLGSAWVASPQQDGKRAGKIIIVLLCIAAAWITLVVFNIERWVDLYRITRTGLSRTEVGYAYQLLLSTGISLLIIGLPAACIGAVLPLMMRAMSAAGVPLGARVGALLTWNTLGAVAGTLITGFLLMPFCGLRNAFGVLALVLGLAAMGIALQRRWPTGVIVTTCASAFAIFLLTTSDTGWQSVISSGIFRIWETKFDPQLMPVRKQFFKIRFYEDAPDATVSVEEADGSQPTSLTLHINGKPDASTGLDSNTQLLLAHLPMLVKINAQDVFVLGFGSGMTAGALLPYPVKRIVIAENCGPVIRAGQLFADWNRHVLDDPRVQVKLGDGRTVLKLHRDLYDVIITEPSNPWTVGVGSVFSREFYEIAASRLKPNGIICQWFHVYEMNDKLLKLILRTLGSVFPYMEIWDNGDICILGSLQPWQTGPDVFRQGFAIDRVRTDMWMMNMHSPEALMARQLASQQTGFAIAGDGPIQSDLFPILEYATPKAFFMNDNSQTLWSYDERTWQQLLAPSGKLPLLASLPQADMQLLFSGSSTINEDLSRCIYGDPGAGGPCAFKTPRPVPPAASDGSPVANAEKAFHAGDLIQAEALITTALKQNPNDAQAGYVFRVVEREKKLRATTVTKGN
jgi:spermidine synthase